MAARLSAKADKGEIIYIKNTKIMKTLNQHSNKIFCAMLEKMDGKQYLKMESEGFMPLIIERIGEQIITPFGYANHYSLCHYYKQMGDMMKDPEMCFIVVDQRLDDVQNYEKIKIIPSMYQQDNVGLFEESVTIIENITKNYAPKLNADHVAFANLWLANIQRQGFLN